MPGSAHAEEQDDRGPHERASGDRDFDHGDCDDDDDEARNDREVQVDEVFFPVQLSDGNTYQIAGYLYHVGQHPNRVIQVAVHGATHFHLYWDFPPINGISYSYARYMARRGYTVLAIDQLGTGASSQPDGDFVTLDETANALHQVLASLRQPHNPTGHRYDDIALIGHSNGSLTSIYATGTYHDADALVTTAWLHVPHPLPFDPAEIIAVLTTPYIPATAFSKEFRTSIFYHVPTTDPDFIDFEQAHLGPAVQARAQFIDLFTAGLDPSLTRSTGVTVPVLVQNGNFDALQPSAFMPDEPTFYPDAEDVTLGFLTDVGHNINGHRNHLQSWRGIDHWLQETLPEHGRHHPHSAGAPPARRP
jgi:alpha-beta hydrolase superfamily lysophospholipase